MTNLKPFEELMPGDVGEDYHECKGTVIAKGTYEQLKKYDSTGACDELFNEDSLVDEDMRNKLVAVIPEDGPEPSLVYVYGYDGFHSSLLTGEALLPQSLLSW